MRVFCIYVLLAISIISLVVFSEGYTWCRSKLNKPSIGQLSLLSRFLKKGDYVCIDNRVLRFSHIAKVNESYNFLSPPVSDNLALGGELAFYDSHGLGYVYYHPSAMKDCCFIYGKYGLKWAITYDYANRAKTMVESQL